MGGYTALRRSHGSRRSGSPALVLAGSRADADAPERAPLREEWIRIARAEGGEGLWEAAAKNFFAPGTPEDVVERRTAIAAEQDPEGLVRAIAAIRDRPDSTEAVTSGIPLLVVAGEHDPLIPAEVARSSSRHASPNGRVEVLDGCGHLPNMERPDEFNRILSAFLASL